MRHVVGLFLFVLNFAYFFDTQRSDLGVHVDGFIAVLAHTTVIQAADAPAISGDLGNLLAAADCAAKVCHRKIKVGLKVVFVSQRHYFYYFPFFEHANLFVMLRCPHRRTAK